MKKIKTLMLLLQAAIFAVSCGPMGRGTDSSGSVNASRILVFHVYDSTFQYYRIYDGTFAGALRKNGITADIRNVYSAGKLNYSSQDAYVKPLETMNREGWVPDVICFFDDRTLSQFLAGTYSQWLPPMDSVPVVAAGLHCPDWNMIRQSNVPLAVCTDLLDFTRNIDLAHKMARYTALRGQRMDSSLVVVELDTSAYDLRVKERMASELNRPPYVFKSDLRIHEMQPEELTEKFKDSIVISTFSNVSYSVDGYGIDEEEIAVLRKKLFQRLSRIPTLTVKMDVENEQILNLTLRPQFTAIRDGFADGLKRYLCGYFASYETVAEDQAEYVARVLKGERAGSLPVRQHQAKPYMDWEAMELLGLKYGDFSKDFEIVGAPWSARHNFHYVLTLALLAVLFIVAVYYIVKALFFRRDFKLDNAIDALEQEHVMMNMALQDADCIIVRSVDDLLGLQDRLYIEDRDVLSDVVNAVLAGQDISNMKFRLTADNGRTYRWWQFRTGERLKSEVHISGIVIDIDDTVRYNDNMAEAALVAEEITRKETFMMNISHEIRTPLNAILGFAQLLSADDDYTEEERVEISRLIRENALFLGEMIEDILQFSRFESGRTDVNPVDTEIESLMTRIYQKWAENVPDGIEFVLTKGRNNVYAMVDPVRIESVMGQYIKNAFKFTQKGLVRLGWEYSLADSKVRLYVDDSGRGIERTRQNLVFNIFWKDDMFKTGVGLGLTIAKMFTENMNGTVGVESISGIGSCFYSTFNSYVK